MKPFKEFILKRHLCSTPGCRNKNSVRLSYSEGARTVLFLCEDCIAGAFGTLAGVDTERCVGMTDVISALVHREKKGEEHGEQE